jgi:hypothetical protein
MVATIAFVPDLEPGRSHKGQLLPNRDGQRFRQTFDEVPGDAALVPGFGSDDNFAALLAIDLSEQRSKAKAGPEHRFAGAATNAQRGYRNAVGQGTSNEAFLEFAQSDPFSG